VALSGVTTTDGNGALYYAAQNGDILSGYFSDEAYVTVADGATVTLCDVVFYAPSKCDHAAIHCLGDANIVLAGSDYNDLHAGSSSAYPALFVPQGNTLTISGTAKLRAYAQDSFSAGIGSGYDYDPHTPINCGTIVIAGGVIKAMGGSGAAGIGSGYRSSCDGIQITGGIITSSEGGARAAGIGSGANGSCGNIEISGGQVGGDYGGGLYYGAIGGEFAAGIGCGDDGTCGDITIGAGITFVTARKGDNTYNCIGVGQAGSCGTVTIDPSLTVNNFGEYVYFSPTAP